MDQPDHDPGQKPARTISNERHHHVPPGTHTFGMVLFLIALGMLFAASLLVYLLIRFGVFGAEQSTPGSTPGSIGTIDLPNLLWLSTAVILASSYTVHAALQNVRHERQSRFRNALTLTLGLAVVFLLVQAPSLAHLLGEHYDQARQQNNFHLHGLAFFLILVHALHLIGGIIPMAIVTCKARAGRYDHEHFGPVRYLAMYWHFLDAVWIVMFAVLLLTT